MRIAERERGVGGDRDALAERRQRRAVAVGRERQRRRGERAAGGEIEVVRHPRAGVRDERREIGMLDRLHQPEMTFRQRERRVARQRSQKAH